MVFFEEISQKEEISEGEENLYSVPIAENEYGVDHTVDYWLTKANYDDLISAKKDNFRKNQYDFMKENKAKITEEFLNNLTANFDENYISLTTILDMQIMNLKTENTEEDANPDPNDNDNDSLIEVLLDLFVENFKEIKKETKNNLIFIFRKIILPTVLENKCESQNKNETLFRLLGNPQNPNPLLTIDDCNLIIKCYKINLENGYQIDVDKSNNKVVITYTLDNKEKIITITINNSIFTVKTQIGDLYSSINDEANYNILGKLTTKNSTYEVPVPVIYKKMWLNKDTYKDKNYSIDETLKSLMLQFIDFFKVNENSLNDSNILALTITVIKITGLFKKKTTPETKKLEYNVSILSFLKSNLNGLQDIFNLIIKKIKINKSSNNNNTKKFKDIKTENIPEELIIQTENLPTYEIPSTKLIYVILSNMLTDFVLTENVKQNRIMSFLVGHVIIPYLLKDATTNSDKFNLQQTLLQLGKLDLTHLNTLVSFLQTQFNKNFIIINENDEIIIKTFENKDTINDDENYYIIKINNDNTITKVDNGKDIKHIKGKELKQKIETLPAPPERKIRTPPIYEASSPASTAPIKVSTASNPTSKSVQVSDPTSKSVPVSVPKPPPAPVQVSNQKQPPTPVSSTIPSSTIPSSTIGAQTTIANFLEIKEGEIKDFIISDNVVVDPAGRAIDNNWDGAEGVSKIIYNQLGLTGDNSKSCIKHLQKTGQVCHNTYTKDKKQYTIIHVHSPNGNSISNNNEFIKNLTESYKNIFNEYKNINDYSKPLILVQVSGGINVGKHKNMPEKNNKSII